MRVLFCALQYEYGSPSQGPSYEVTNFFDTLQHMPGVDAELFPFDGVVVDPSRRVHFNAHLIERAFSGRYDLLFFHLFRDEITPETIAKITRKTNVKTFNWFADDHWRLPVYSRHYAPLFTAVSTTDGKSFSEYHRLGIHNVIKTQWAANPRLYKPTHAGGEYSVTFVGQGYGVRGEYIDGLKRAGIPAEGFGSTWPSGRISEEKKLDIFTNSRVSLNFAETPFVGQSVARLGARLFMERVGGRYRFIGHRILSNIRSEIGAMRGQIKGRVFEIPACGGFELTGAVDDNLGDYYVDGQEVAVFNSPEDLAAKCRYYLEHPDERDCIARAGYERTIRDHTYEQRFTEIFNQIM